VKTSSISAAFGTAALLAAITTPAFADQTNGSIDQTNGNSSAVVLVNPAATLAGNVLSAASGNIGANVASGVGNQQANFTQIHTNNGTSYPYGYGNSKSERSIRRPGTSRASRSTAALRRSAAIRSS